MKCAELTAVVCGLWCWIIRLRLLLNDMIDYPKSHIILNWTELGLEIVPYNVFGRKKNAIPAE